MGSFHAPAITVAQCDRLAIMSESSCAISSFASAFTQACSAEAQCISNPSSKHVLKAMEFEMYKRLSHGIIKWMPPCEGLTLMATFLKTLCITTWHERLKSSSLFFPVLFPHLSFSLGLFWLVFLNIENKQKARSHSVNGLAFPFLRVCICSWGSIRMRFRKKKTLMQMGHTHIHTCYTTESRYESKTYADKLDLLMTFWAVSLLSTAKGFHCHSSEE